MKIEAAVKPFASKPYSQEGPRFYLLYLENRNDCFSLRSKYREVMGYV